MTLVELLKRLEGAEGPDMKLAHDIALALGAEKKWFDVGDGDEEWWLEWPDGKRVKNFTASIDAAVKLVEQVLPGKKWAYPESGWVRVIDEQGRTLGATEPKQDHIALALCTALIRAKLEEEPQ